jgi:hypothetical protein
MRTLLKIAFAAIIAIIAYCIGRSNGYTEGYDSGVEEEQGKKDLENSFAEGEALPSEE